MRNYRLPLAAALLLGNLAYVFAVTTSFNFLLLSRFGYAPIVILLLVIAGGVFAMLLGYVSIVFLGGHFSLGVANFYAILTRSTHIMYYDRESSKTLSQRLISETYLAYAAGLVFLLLVSIAWDLHNADGPHAGIFYSFLNATNIFLTRTDNVNPIRFSVNSLPLLFLLTALAGLIPSLTLPYLRNFRVTSVNSGPFHTSLLLTVVGLVAGLSAILTITGLIYKVLWASAARAAPSYHFILLVMLGFSLHYAAGSYIGRDRAEKILVKSLENRPTKGRVFFGAVKVLPKGTAQSD